VEVHKNGLIFPFTSPSGEHVQKVSSTSESWRYLAVLPLSATVYLFVYYKKNLRQR
jgi:hypothetical protein